jgi:hypothetical protein
MFTFWENRPYLLCGDEIVKERPFGTQLQFAANFEFDSNVIDVSNVQPEKHVLVKTEIVRTEAILRS